MIKYGHPPRGDAGFSERLSIFWIFFILGGIMKKLGKIFLIIIITIIVGLLIAFGIKKYLDYREEMRIKNAIIKIEFIEPLEVVYNTEVKVSDLITSINGEFITNPIIDTSKVGTKEVSFRYLNEEDIKVPYKFTLKIIDNTPPTLTVGSSYTVKKGYDKKLEDVLFCADDYDDNPTCEIIGEYDLNTLGTYPLTYRATDFSGNQTEKNFDLKVVSKTSSSNSSSSSIPFQKLYDTYKNENTMIGIDVSKWQGNINFEKIKDTGIEFVYIKVGGQNGIDKDYYLDSKFKQNIEGFKNIGIPVGLYFYSYANSVSKGRNDALWVIDQIKDYDIDLPIAFDWENWSSYNKFHVSFNTLTKTAEAFMDTLKAHGYQSMLYSSKYYLENMWMKTSYPIWLAHYTANTTYEGEYKCWQRTSSAKISGITGNTVDFDICYK